MDGFDAWAPWLGLGELLWDDGMIKAHSMVAVPTQGHAAWTRRGLIAWAPLAYYTGGIWMEKDVDPDGFDFVVSFGSAGRTPLRAMARLWLIAWRPCPRRAISFGRGAGEGLGHGWVQLRVLLWLG